VRALCRRFLICALILVGGCAPLRNRWEPAPLPERPLTELRAEIMEKDAHPLDEHFGTLVSLSFGDSLLAVGPEEARSEFQDLLGRIGVGELSLTTEDVQSCGTGLYQTGVYRAAFPIGPVPRRIQGGGFHAYWELEAGDWRLRSLNLNPATRRGWGYSSGCLSAPEDVLRRNRWALIIYPLVQSPLSPTSDVISAMDGVLWTKAEFERVFAGALRVHGFLPNNFGSRSRIGSPGFMGVVRGYPWGVFGLETRLGRTAEEAFDAPHPPSGGRMILEQSADFATVLFIWRPRLIQVGVGPTASRTDWSWTRLDDRRRFVEQEETRGSVALGLTMTAGVIFPLPRGVFLELGTQAWIMPRREAPGFHELEPFHLGVRQSTLTLGLGMSR